MYKICISNMDHVYVAIFLKCANGDIYYSPSTKEILYAYTHNLNTLSASSIPTSDYTEYNSLEDLRDSIIIHLAMNGGAHHLKCVLPLVEQAIATKDLKFEQGQ